MSKQQESSSVVLEGRYYVWNLYGSPRTYADIHISFADAQKFILPLRYNAVTGKGEQRALVQSHVNKLESAIAEGNYTPTQLSAGLHDKHRERLTLNEEERTFRLELVSSDPLAQTDGGHRYAAIAKRRKAVEEAIEKAASDEEKAKLQEEIAAIDNIDVGFRLYFDGNLKIDFVNLQAGLKVDATHILSLRIQQRLLKEPEWKTAFEIAKALNKGNDKSPFKGLIRFDSNVNTSSLVKQIPISTFCAKAASDLSTSLIGLAKLVEGTDAKALAELVVNVYRALEANAPELLEENHFLTPALKGGTKGSSTMLIGLAICARFHEMVAGDIDMDRLIEAAKETLSDEVNGNFSSARKRELMGDFAKEYLKGMDVTYHERVPADLVRALSASAFAVGKLASPVATEEEVATLPAKTKKKRAKAAEIENGEPDEVSTESLEEKLEETEVAPWERAEIEA